MLNDDSLLGNYNFSENFFKEEFISEDRPFNFDNSYDDKFFSINENNKLFPNDSFHFSDIDDRDESSSNIDINKSFKDYDSLFLDIESKDDINNYNKKEKSDLFDEEISQNFQNSSINDKSIREKVKTNQNENRYKSYITKENRSLSNIENHDIKEMDQTLPLNGNDYYSNIINKESFYLNETQLNLNSQNSFPNYKYNNETGLSNKSKINSSFSFGKNSIGSCDLTFSNKKRQRSIKFNNTFQNIKNNNKNILDFLPNQNINKNKTTIFRVIKKSNFGRKKEKQWGNR
jgi:hypothetical protein